MAVTVTAQDIREAAYGLTIPEGVTVDKAIERLIDKALVRLYVAFPTLDARIANPSDRVTADQARGVVEDMVLRVLRNPNAYRQVSIDDYARMIDTALSTGALYLSPEERGLLSPRRRRPAVRSIRLSVPGWRYPGA